jgi:hypothetical protein
VQKQRRISWRVPHQNSGPWVPVEVEPVFNHHVTPLASSQVNHDQLKVELVELDTMPAMVRIVRPPQPTMVDPRRFPDTAATIAPVESLQLAQQATLEPAKPNTNRAAWPNSGRHG